MKSDKELTEKSAEILNLPERGWMGPAFMYVKDNIFTDWDPLNEDEDAIQISIFTHQYDNFHIKDGKRRLQTFYGSTEPVDLANLRRLIVEQLCERYES